MEDDRTSLMSARALQTGHEILWYTIEKVLGQGGFGITYLAHDRNLDRSVAIKEYLPTPFAYRHRDFSVKPLTGEHRDHFTWGLDSFQREARTLAKFGHDNIVRVHSVFEQNNTAYMVMEYEDGQSLAYVYDKQKERLNQDFFQQVFFPIFDGLKEIHKFGFIHRDIKPANIYIRHNRTPVLIDFGSARETSHQQSAEMTTLVTQGYTPLEQYSSNYGEQGPWTDIYALAATIYEGVVGQKPDESLSRSACMLRNKPDLIQQLQARDFPGYTQPFLDALISGLALEPENRPADLNRWLGEYYATDTTTPSAAPGNTATEDYFSALEDSALEDEDRTQILPRNQLPGGKPYSADLTYSVRPEHLEKEKAGRSRSRAQQPRAESLTMVLNKAHKPAASDQVRGRNGDQYDISLDNMDFLDDSDIHTIDPAYTAANEESDFSFDSPADTRRQDNKGGLARKLIRGMAAVMVVSLLAGASFALYRYLDNTSGGGATAIDQAMLKALPVPVQPVDIVLPKDIVIQQLGSMQVMAALYKQASGIDPNNPELNRSMDATLKKLTAIASRWNAGSHPQIANKVTQVAEQIPVSAQLKSGLFTLLKNSDTRSDAALLKQQLSSGNLAPGGDLSVFELVYSLSQADFDKLTRSSEWRSLLEGYRQTALEKIRTSDFDSAASLVAAGLSLEPADAELALLRDHLRRL